MDMNNEVMTCKFCKHKYKSDTDYPCNVCTHSYTNKFEQECETCKMLKGGNRIVNMAVWMNDSFDTSGGCTSSSVSSYNITAKYCPKCGAKL